MDPILDRIGWHMHWDIHASVDECVAKVHIDHQSLTPKELETVLHPSGPWYAKMNFDERAFMSNGQEKVRFVPIMLDNQRYAVWSREEPFEATTTLHDFLKRIASGPCYGYLEGLVYDGTVERKAYTNDTWHKETFPMFKICWGT
jgi:hypothetical protein